MSSKMLNLPAYLVAENNVGSYTVNEKTKIKDMIKTYLDNKGFVVLESGGKFRGYFDIFSIDLVKTIKKEDYERAIEEVNLNFKTEKLFEDDRILKAKNLLKGEDLEFVPVLNKNEKVIGRTNEKIINKRIRDILENGFSLER